LPPPHSSSWRPVTAIVSRDRARLVCCRPVRSNDRGTTVVSSSQVKSGSGTGAPPPRAGSQRRARRGPGVGGGRVRGGVRDGCVVAADHGLEDQRHSRLVGVRRHAGLISDRACAFDVATYPIRVARAQRGPLRRRHPPGVARRANRKRNAWHGDVSVRSLRSDRH
jgi:hypothetical protein